MSFHVDLRPYTDFARMHGSRFLMHPGVVCARRFVETGAVPADMLWDLWGDGGDTVPRVHLRKCIGEGVVVVAVHL